MDMNMFWQVSNLANMLCPVTTALDLGQSDKTTIADACNLFMNLLNEPVLQDHREKVQKRFDFVIKPCHLVAYMLHHQVPGCRADPWADLDSEGVSNLWRWSFPPSSHCFLSRSNPLFSFLLHCQRPGQQPNDMVESLGIIINRSPGWLHQLYCGATICSGIICSSGASLSVALGCYSPSSATSSDSRKLQSWCSSTG